jgi:hypothetical protein
MFAVLKRLFRRSETTPTGAPWPFAQSGESGVITMRQILERTEPILFVSHDADDDRWQFFGTTDANVADGRVVALKEIVALDATVLALADLPRGWQAARSAPDAPWERRAAQRGS